MYRLASYVVMGLFAAIPVLASDQPISVRRDTQFPVAVKHTIKADSAKVGDEVEFRTDAPVLIGNRIVVPRNSVILGTVTEVQKRSAKSEISTIRIRIHTLVWKQGRAALNAMVSSVRRPNSDVPGWDAHTPTFLEGIQIIAHQRPDSFTEFSSTRKNVSIHSGVSLILRQVEPGYDPVREFQVQTEDQSVALF